MLTRTRMSGRSGPLSFLLPLGGGLIIAVSVTAMVSALPLQMVFAAFAAIALFGSSLLVKEVRPYWLAIYVFAFFMEGRGFNLGRFITSDPVADPEWVMQKLGVPAGELGLRVFPSDLILFALIAVWLSKVAARNETIYLPKIAYLAVAYLTWATAASLFKAPYIYLSASELVQQYKYFLLYLYVLNTVHSHKVLKPTILALMLVVLVEGTLTALNLRSPTEEHELAYSDTKVKTRRAAGLHGPQLTAFKVESIIPLALTLFVVSRRAKHKWPLLFILVLGSLALFGAHSRAAWMGLTVGLSTVACLLLRRGLLPKWQFLTLAYVSLLLLFISSPALIPKVISYMWARPETFYGRFESFAQGATLIADNVITVRP